MKRISLILLGIGMMMAVSCTQLTDRDQFDLESPPSDWFKFDDPNYNISVWLPDDWEADVWDVPDSDVSEPTHYHPTGKDTVTEIWINIVRLVDFKKDYCNPLINDCGDPPLETYDIQVGDVDVPCARYDLGSFRWRHICVIGPYSAKQFHPESVGGEISILFSLQTTEEWETQVVPIWKKVVTSFVLEQPPEIK